MLRIRVPLGLALLLAGCSKETPAPVASEASLPRADDIAPSSIPSMQPAPPPPDPCGSPQGPACPLKQWMKANTALAMNARDFDGLKAALEQVSRLAPPGYTNWASIARDGADAARVGDLEAVRAACRGCHGQYRERYKKELRARPIAS